MKVLKRDQITEVVTKRTIFHSLEYKGKKYSRTNKITSTLGSEDDEVVTAPNKPEWLLVDKGCIMKKISNVMALELEARYQTLTDQQKKGHIYY
jgi:hydrogenase maturation factor